MFPPDTMPPTRCGSESLKIKGFKFQFTRQLGEQAFPDYDRQLVRAPSGARLHH